MDTISLSKAMALLKTTTTTNICGLKLMRLEHDPRVQNLIYL
jgi:hypothetical protein